jgi:type III secretion system YscQ/HrcQ family protein
MSVTSYPWGALEPVAQGASRAAARARQALGTSLAPLQEALTLLLELPAELLPGRARLGPVPALPGVLWLSSSSPTLTLGLLAEPALASFLSARVLGRPEPLSDPRAPLPSALEGLLAALIVETARRAGVALTLLDSPPGDVDDALSLEGRLLLDGRPFLFSAWIVGADWAAPKPARLASLGALPLRVPLVLTAVTLTRSELHSLEVGGALLLPLEASLGLAGARDALLAAPSSERGIAVELRPDGRLVVGGEVSARLTMDPEAPSEDDGHTLTDALLDSPVVVRVELGAVSMTARELAQLGPGDVIETTQRIAQPVVLRVAGHEVGQGVLVNVDGHVGVRIQKLNELP